MFFAGGFLIASLIGLAMAPLIHGRAARLTERDIAANSPFSMTEIKADRDQLRADFAVSTRRLEQQFERFRARAAAQIAILGRKADGINRLKAERGAQNAAMLVGEANAKALRE